MAKNVSKFTEQMVEKMVATYDSEASDTERRAQVKSLADEFNLTTRQIIGKLSTMPDRVTYTPYAAKAPRVRKATNIEIVGTIAEAIGSTVNDLASLERASKAALLAIAEAVKPAEPEKAE